MSFWSLSQDQRVELAQIAQTIATPGKGILAADEHAGNRYCSLIVNQYSFKV